MIFIYKVFCENDVRISNFNYTDCTARSSSIIVTAMINFILCESTNLYKLIEKEVIVSWLISLYVVCEILECYDRTD